MKNKILIGISLVIITAGSFVTGRITTPVKTIDNVKEEIVQAASIQAKEEIPEAGTLEFYQQLVKDNPQVEIVESNELTYEEIVNRNGKLIVEKVIGKVINEAGDGEILNCWNPEYNYISYDGMGYSVGDVIVTYCIYNPDNNYEDDIIERFDYIIDKTGDTVE